MFNVPNSLARSLSEQGLMCKYKFSLKCAHNTLPPHIKHALISSAIYVKREIVFNSLESLFFVIKLKLNPVVLACVVSSNNQNAEC